MVTLAEPGVVPMSPPGSAVVPARTWRDRSPGSVRLISMAEPGARTRADFVAPMSAVKDAVSGIGDRTVSTIAT